MCRKAQKANLTPNLSVLTPSFESPADKNVFQEQNNFRTVDSHREVDNFPGIIAVT